MQSMNKQEYLKSLEEIVQDSIYITDRTDELKKEIQTNHWSISINSVTAKLVETEDIVSFLERVKQSRAEQLNLSTVDVDLVFYLWFDEQAGNLNFNFINSNHLNLPFALQIENVDKEVVIIEEFLNSKYVGGIEWDELQAMDESPEVSNRMFKVKVYTEAMKRKPRKHNKNYRA
jgi:hypothetical protein